MGVEELSFVFLVASYWLKHAFPPEPNQPNHHPPTSSSFLLPTKKAKKEQTPTPGHLPAILSPPTENRGHSVAPLLELRASPHRHPRPPGRLAPRRGAGRLGGAGGGAAGGVEPGADGVCGGGSPGERLGGLVRFLFNEKEKENIFLGGEAQQK